MRSPLVSISSSYSAPGAKGSLVVGSGEFKANDGCTLRTIIDVAGSPGSVKAYRSVMSNRASPRGNPKLGPEAWCDIWILLSEFYSALAISVLFLHALYILWVAFGALLTRSRPIPRWLHISSLVWG